MFEPGEVVRFFSPIAGKTKFHLCLCVSDGGERNLFLFINSGSGFRGDYVVDDGAIPGLPPSPTGETVVSFSQVVKMTERQLAMYKAKGVGCIDPSLAGELLHFARRTPALTDIDRELVVAALEEQTSK